MGQPIPVMDRIWVKVDKTSDPNGCWLWTGAKNSGPGGGYGIIFIREEWDEDGKRKQIFGRVHVVVYANEVGPVPPGAVVDHVWRRGCRNRHCCNPAHLEAIGVVENTFRGREKNEHYCKVWHERTPENTEIRPSGWLSCLTCKEITHQRALARGREKRREQRELKEREASIRRIESDATEQARRSQDRQAGGDGRRGVARASAPGLA